MVIGNDKPGIHGHHGACKMHGIAFLGRYGVHHPFTIVADHPFTDMLPAVINGMIQRFFLGETITT